MHIETKLRKFFCNGMWTQEVVNAFLTSYMGLIFMVL